ncbi:PLP-dependent aminotransferase family protein [Sinomonas sp. ASV322]|uniref:aminotransferase-like domain-containing protein n=1 Tax=Sinomonas sp. ASV322 TaxID=3041920 RepID=UPI0027DCDB69|nr:PLP-dependent aminotransferase family protein [Sinomonas sp. ASV322]MDQ4503869.1 PLP-dependent aminotransferase family protein [Sinomonas sp. ASV322]
MTTTLDFPLFAARAEGYRPSPVRDFWAVSMQPGVISLAGGNPDLSVLPLGELGDVAARLVATRGLDALQYGAGKGTDGARAAVVRVMDAEGIAVDPDSIQITAGSQMALELVVKLLCDPGDVVLAEGPSYVGAIGVFAGLEASVVHVPMDDGGLRPDALEATIAQVRSEGRRIKALYTIPNFHNPTGITLAADRRPEIVRICADAGIAIIEDNPYGLLAFDGVTLPSLHDLDPENVFYLGSFSKIVAPGLRVGWAAVPRSARRRLQLAAEATTICASVLSQMIIEEYVTRHDWLGVLDRARALYLARSQAVQDALVAHAPAGTQWSVPRGGFFTWLTLPEGASASHVLDAAIENRVVFVPGTAFFADGQGQGNLRVAFSLENEATLAEGVARLGAAIATA